MLQYSSKEKGEGGEQAKKVCVHIDLCFLRWFFREVPFLDGFKANNLVHPSFHFVSSDRCRENAVPTPVDGVILPFKITKLLGCRVLGHRGCNSCGHSCNFTQNCALAWKIFIFAHRLVLWCGAFSHFHSELCPRVERPRNVPACKAKKSVRSPYHKNTRLAPITKN